MLKGLKVGSKLDRPSVRGYAWVFAAINALSLAILLITSNGGIDRFGHLLGSDFLSFWAVGKMALEGAAPYDTSLHLEMMRDFAPTLQGYPAFYYPPLFLLLCASLALLPYFASLAVWLAVTGAAWIGAVRLWTREMKLELPLLPWVAAFTPVLITITHGQTSFLVAALLGAGLLLVRDRPVLAGILLGLATFKPQFGLLVPVALLLTGSWRTIISASATALAFAALTTVVFGVELWAEWYAVSSQAQAVMADGTVGFGKMVSLFAGLRLLGVSEANAYAFQIALSLVMVLLVAWASWRQQFSPLLAALVLAAAPLATPFVLDYDMLLLAFPLVYLAATGYREWEKTVSAAVFVAPMIGRPIAMNLGVPIMPLVIGLLVWVLWRRVALKPVD